MSDGGLVQCIVAAEVELSHTVKKPELTVTGCCCMSNEMLVAVG